jgi:hypothetical protein
VDRLRDLVTVKNRIKIEMAEGATEPKSKGMSLASNNEQNRAPRWKIAVELVWKKRLPAGIETRR